MLERDFTAEAPNKVWVTDVTYIATDEGWLYLAVDLDLFSRRVVGWATSATNDRLLALDALNRALAARKPRRGLLHHSDRGSPYASADYREALRRRGIVASMSRNGDCWDNAVAESFFARSRPNAFLSAGIDAGPRLGEVFRSTSMCSTIAAALTQRTAE